MKILMIIPSLGNGGAEKVVLLYSRYLQKIGYEVHIAHVKECDIFYDVNELNLHAVNRLSAKCLLPIIKSLKIDIVWDHYHWNLEHLKELEVIKKSCNAKVMITEHSSYFFPIYSHLLYNSKECLSLFIEREAIYKNLDAVTTLTNASNALFGKSSNSVLLPNPLPHNPNSKAELSSQSILTVSNFFKKVKRADRFFEIIAHLKKKGTAFSATFVGDFSEKQKVEFEKNLELQHNDVDCVGRQSELERYYLNHSVFALTSEVEGFSMVIIEASSYGLPIVAYRFQGIEDVIEDGKTGFIVEQGDVEGFVDKLDLLLKDSQLRTKMGNNARDFVTKQFSMEHIGQRLEMILKGVIDKKNFKDEQVDTNSYADEAMKEYFNLMVEVAKRNTLKTAIVSNFMSFYRVVKGFVKSF